MFAEPHNMFAKPYIMFAISTSSGNASAGFECHSGGCNCGGPAQSHQHSSALCHDGLDEHHSARGLLSWLELLSSIWQEAATAC